MKWKAIYFTGWLMYNLAVMLFASKAGAAEIIAIEKAPTPAVTETLKLRERRVFQIATTKHPWRWSKPSAHHRAVVNIVSNGKSGSGVYFKTKRLAGILTAKHVVSGSGPYRIIWPDGHVDISRKRVSDTHGNDLAIVLLKRLRRDVVPVSITSRDTYVGETLEMAGYGGPGRDIGDNTLRHFWVVQSDKTSSKTKDRAEPGAMHGDSGGPIFSFQNGKPHVVSVCNSGTSSTNKKQKMPGGVASWYGDVHYPTANRLVGFVAEVEQSLTAEPESEAAEVFRNRGRIGSVVPKVCPPGGCPPHDSSPSPSPRKKQKPDEDYELYPPEGFGLEKPQQQQQPAEESGSGGLVLVLIVGIATAAVCFHKRVTG